MHIDLKMNILGGQHQLRKTAIITIIAMTLMLCYFTSASIVKLYRAGSPMPAALQEQEVPYRLVLITQEMDTPFWDLVGDSALAEAEKQGISLQIWGSYGSNEDDFLKKMEIAIASKVDGIIVQGLDTEEFNELTKIQAGRHGIPVITVASDVPMQDSLRRTYVGSDHKEAGRLVARELLSDMGQAGTVILIGGSRQRYDQDLRLAGIHDILQHYPDIHTVFAEAPDERERVVSAARDVMNRYPEADALIAVNSNITETLVREIGKRYHQSPFRIYSFDDSPETMELLKAGKLEGMILQSPEEMGRISVDLMVKWLKSEAGPLDMNGYYTNIRMVKAEELP